MYPDSLPPVVVQAMMVALALGVAAWVIGARIGPPGARRRSLWWSVAALIPAVGFVASFFSLAWHMFRALGGWPDSIGMAGFPDDLIAHADAALAYFGIFLAGSVIVWPLAFGVALAVRRLRGALVPLGTYAIAFAASLSAMALAPSRFLYWWWD